VEEAERPVLLVLRALGLGDFLTGIPALRALAEAFPEHRRILAAPLALSPLVRLSRTVDGMASCPGLDVPPEVEAPVDVAVNLHGRGPESHHLLLADQPEQLLAFRHPDVPGTEGLPGWRFQEHEVARWCRMLRELDIACDPLRLELAVPEDRIEVRPEATIVHPGAASQARRWPAERWGRVVRSETAAGRVVLVTGSAGERDLCLSVAREAGLPPDQVLAGKTNLEQLAFKVAGAGRVVCGDTGMAHLATALGTPSVVLYGPTSPALWGPPEGSPVHRVLWNGSTGDPHGTETDPGLLAIEVDEVLEALASLPDGVQAGA
jgi:ADP-heptose:LPS heptosyltransferase